MKKFLLVACLITNFMCQARYILMTGSYHGTVWHVKFDINDDIKTLEDAWIVSLDGSKRTYVPYISNRLVLDSSLKNLELDFECSQNVAILVLGFMSKCPCLSLLRNTCGKDTELFFDEIKFDESWMRNLLLLHSTGMLIEALKAYTYFVLKSVEQDPLARFMRDLILKRIKYESKKTDFDATPYYTFLMMYGDKLLSKLRATRPVVFSSYSEIKISPDGKLIAVPSRDNGVFLWSLSTGELKGVLK